MNTNGYRVFDCDSHVFEPGAVWEEYLEAAYRVPGRSAFWHQIDEFGVQTVILNGKPAKPMNRSKIVRQAIWRPGMTPEQIGELDPKRFHALNPGAEDSEARLRDMDAMGIEGALLFPTLFAEYFPVVENPDVAHALARAYNDWVYDFCQAAPDRLFPAAVLPLQNLTFAVAEARRNAARGFRAAAVRPSFSDGRFLNHPYYDPLWQTLEGLGVAVFIAPSPGSTNPEWTSVGSWVDRVAGNLRIGHYVAEAIAPMVDNAVALSAFILYGHMERYPTLKIGYAGSGASWVTVPLERAESRLVLQENIHDVHMEPEHVFFNRPSLVTFDASDSAVGRQYPQFAEIAAWGSQYPRHDASTPEEALRGFERKGVPGEIVARMMGGNARGFLGLGAA
jgi:predicted TIM-barrel fold metal-dependent hydrolase